MDLKERMKKLKSNIPVIYFALKDKETPWLAKLLAGVTIAYALSPIDLIPDFIPILGYLDDLIFLPAMIALTMKCIPKSIWERSRVTAAALWANKNHKKWYYAILIVVIWILVISWIIKWILC